MNNRVESVSATGRYYYICHEMMISYQMPRPGYKSSNFEVQSGKNSKCKGGILFGPSLL